jgi:hypothetical protein
MITQTCLYARFYKTTVKCNQPIRKLGSRKQFSPKQEPLYVIVEHTASKETTGDTHDKP